MSVKRYYAPAIEDMEDGTLVLATDYDAIAKRLEEAERLLRRYANLYNDGELGLHLDAEDFLKARP